MSRIKMSHLKYIFMFLLITFLVGIQNFFFAKFDTSIFGEGTFWSDTVSTSSSYYLTIIMVVFMYSEKQMKINLQITRPKEIIAGFAQNGIKPAFYDFNDEDNLKRKIEAWVFKIKRKISTLDQLASPLDRQAWKDKDYTNEYVSDRQQQLDLISDDYIKENIHFLQVDYEHVYESTITNGYTPKLNKQFKKQNSIWKITKDTAPKFILSTVYTIFLTSFALTFKDFSAEVVYKMVVKIIGLILSGVWAANYAPQFVEEQIIVPLNNAVNYIRRFEDSTKKKAGEQVEKNQL